MWQFEGWDSVVSPVTDGCRGGVSQPVKQKGPLHNAAMCTCFCIETHTPIEPSGKFEFHHEVC